MPSLRLSINSKNELGYQRSNFARRNLEVNRLNTEQTKPKKKHAWLKILLGLVLFVGIGVAVWQLFFTKISSSDPLFVKNVKKEVEKVTIPELKQDKNGYTNFLLIGKDTREWSKGLQNTDSIIVGSYNDETGEIMLVSIPRDMFVEYPGLDEYYRKINGIYSYGEKKGKGQGVDYLIKVAEDVTGLEMHYWAMVDLGGFKKAIDVVGGVEVNVDNAFTDYYFPNDSTSGYRTVKFEEGEQHMDGATALDYARSRKGCCGEGSDFARARRQQKVIGAFLDKLLKMENLNIDTALQLKETFDTSVTYSEVSVADIRAGLARINKVGSEKVTSIVLDPSLQNGTLIIHPNPSEAGGAYAIWPAAGLGNWSKVQAFLQNVIKDPALFREAAKVYTYNGGLGYAQANTESGKIKKVFNQLTVTYGGNNGASDVTDVVILVTNEKPETLKRLKTYIQESLGHKVQIVRTMDDFQAKHKEDISIIFGAPAPEETEETDSNN